MVLWVSVRCILLPLDQPYQELMLTSHNSQQENE